jgi:hypothetical protein
VRPFWAPAEAQGGQAAAQPQKKEKKVKDQGEYDVFNAVTKEADDKKKVELLKQWKAKYPESDYKEDRLIIMIQTYTKLGQAQEIFNTAKEMLAQFPKNVTGLYWVCTLVPGLSKEDPESLASADQAANGLLNAEKPEGTKDEDWAKAKKDFEVLAHKTLGWAAWKRKNLDVAEKDRQDPGDHPQQRRGLFLAGSGDFPDEEAGTAVGSALSHFARASARSQAAACRTPPRGRTPRRISSGPSTAITARIRRARQAEGKSQGIGRPPAGFRSRPDRKSGSPGERVPRKEPATGALARHQKELADPMAINTSNRA